MFFRSLGSQESNASNDVQIGVETKKLWPFEDNRIKLCENFATAKSVAKSAAKSTFCCKNFIAQSPFHGCDMSCEMKSTCENFARCFTAEKPPASTRVPLRKLKLHLRSCEPRCEITSKLRNKLKIISKVQNHLQVVKSQIQLAKSKFKPGKWIIQRVNHLAKSTFSCEMDNSTCKIHLCKLRYFLPT